MICNSYPCVPGIEFRDVQGFLGYCVGTDGSLWSCRRHGRERDKLIDKWVKLKGRRTRRGYIRDTFRRNGKTFQFYRQEVVLTAFVGARPDGMEACHFPDRNPENNAVANLAWGTRTDNMAHALLHNTMARGSRNGQSKLTEFQAAALRNRYSRGESVASLTREAGITASTLYSLLLGKTWKHVPQSGTPAS